MVALVLGQSVPQALTGIALGGVLATAAGAVLAGNIQGMPFLDVVALIGGSLCVLLACVGAAAIPSRQATAIDPTTALRRD